MGFSLSSRTARPRSNSIWVSGLALKYHRAASTLTSSSRSEREMALPVRLLIRTTSPSRSSFTSCISTISSRSLPLRPSASRAPFSRATWPWWSAPQMLMTLSKPRTANLFR